MEYGLQLASFVHEVQWRNLEDPLKTKVIDHVIDTVGVMFSGITMQACADARQAAALWGESNEATVVGTTLRLPAPNAAFVNALHGRIHTFDDTYEPGTMHSGSPVVSAALALAERQNTDGLTFLNAVIAGYELAARVAAAVSPGHYASGFHNTGTCTVFGAAAAASRILGLAPTEIAEALGLAGTTAAGLRQHQIDGSMLDSAFHGARAAQSGVMCAQLRQQGVKGPKAILEGPLGFCAVMAPVHDLTRLNRGLGEVFEFEKMTIKLYPTCRFAHGPIEAALSLKRKYQINSEEIANVNLSTFRQSMEVSDRPELRSSFDAVVSHQYAVANALVNGKVELNDIVRYKSAAPHIIALMKKVSVTHDKELEKDFPRCWPHYLKISMKNGQTYDFLSQYPPGREQPISSAQVDEKFLHQSIPFLGQEKANKALSLLRQVDQLKHMTPLTQCLACN